MSAVEPFPAAINRALAALTKEPLNFQDLPLALAAALEEVRSRISVQAAVLAVVAQTVDVRIEQFIEALETVTAIGASDRQSSLEMTRLELIDILEGPAPYKPM